MSTASPRAPLRYISTWIALLDVFGLVALLVWSAWWPHSDLRQIWAFAAAILAFLVGAGALVWALTRVARRDRRQLLTLTGVAVVLGATVGFGMLFALTSSYR
jgi:predicted Kef-type K+ transport protein